MSERGGYRVLVVEDEQALRGMVASHLRTRRFEVAEAGSAEEVLGALRDRSLDYQVALVDIHLPGMSGSDLSRLLLATWPLRPVVMITGDDDAALARRILGYGATGYLLKPFQLFELDAALAQAVGMLDLVETTQVLARAQAEHLDDWGEVGGMLPRSWLHLGDERSGAGGGHGARVVSVAGLLAKAMGGALTGRDRELLRTAGRTHEIGRLLGPAEPGEVALRTAQLLDDLGFDPDVAETIRQAAEPWSPAQPLRARILALADALDHDAVQRAQGGRDDEEAVAEAIGMVLACSGELFDPDAARTLQAQRESVESMWVLQREAVPA